MPLLPIDITKLPKADNVSFTKKSLGYVDGYGKYEKRTGGHEPNGTEKIEKVQKGEEKIQTQYNDKFIDNQTGKFRNIFGYGNTKGTKKFKYDSNYEDPTYLIFDLTLITDKSPLFNNVKKFLADYSGVVPEIAEVSTYYDEFINQLFKIFPTDNSGSDNGNKRHYIESVGGLDVLSKKIVNYPNDIISFVVSEDIAMSMQYLAELYNNLVYSYNTHRYLIPDNLLRFNMRISIRDIRNMMDYDGSNLSYNDSISQMAYVLHDCQFDFSHTRNFGSDIVNGGFGSRTPMTPAKCVINMNLKSFSKITVPSLIKDSKVIDLREKEGQSFGNYKTSYNTDYKSPDDIVAINEKDSDDKKTKKNPYLSSKDINSKIAPAADGIVRGFVNDVKNEIKEVRNVIVKKIQDEAQILKNRANLLLGRKAGFTIGKVNVYYDSLNEKVTNFSNMFSDFLDKEVQNGKSKIKNSEKLYGYEPKKPEVRQGSIYGNNNTGPKVNYRPPSGRVEEKGKYNDKYPEGNV